jgi:hypothetical protein
MMEALIFTLSAMGVLWLSEMLMLAKDDWTVSRRTPVSNLLGAKGNSFCSIFWGSSAIYIIGCYVVLGLTNLVVELLVGLSYLMMGMESLQGNVIIAILIIVLAIVVALGLKRLIGLSYRGIKGKVETTEFKRVGKQTQAVKEVYKVFKDKYCPIIK